MFYEVRDWKVPDKVLVGQFDFGKRFQSLRDVAIIYKAFLKQGKQTEAVDKFLVLWDLELENG